MSAYLYRCSDVLHVSRTLPTVTVKSFTCSNCGPQVRASPAPTAAHRYLLNFTISLNWNWYVNSKMCWKNYDNFSLADCPARRVYSYADPWCVPESPPTALQPSITIPQQHGRPQDIPLQITGRTRSCLKKENYQNQCCNERQQTDYITVCWDVWTKVLHWLDRLEKAGK